MAGIDVPYDTKVLIYETEDTSHDCAWANEKLTTLLGMYKAETLDEAYDICYKLCWKAVPVTLRPCTSIPPRQRR